jgi:hypothetical protein
MATKKAKEKEEDVEPVDPIDEAKDLVFSFMYSAGNDTEVAMEALNNLINIVDEQAIHQIREEISVFYPEQTFAPYPYNSFRCGNLWYRLPTYVYLLPI